MNPYKADHPFLGEINHRVEVILLAKSFLENNFSLKVNQTLIGHLFFGQRAFSLKGRDIGLVYGDETKYYPDTSCETIFSGPIVLIDETGTCFDIGIGEILKDDIGFYFQNILINIKIKKLNATNVSCFYDKNFFIQIYKIDSYGLLKELSLDETLNIKKSCSEFILNTIFFNLEKLSSF